MRLMEFLLLVLVGWTAVGALGITVSFLQDHRQKAVRHLGWLIAVWVIYLTVVITVSVTQRQRFVAVGTPQCFDEMCFTVVGFDEPKGYLLQDNRLVRVRVTITNRGHKPESESLLHAYLVDQQGQRWDEVPGLSGVRLTARVAAGETVTSEPVYKVGRDTAPEGLILTHGQRQPGVLVIGDSDSLLHRPTVARLK
jgi:hypothetical protein